jgi:hypothetical protein
MNKNNTLQDNFSSFFILKGVTAILIGIYIYGGAYIIKALLDGILIEDNPIGFMSAENIELLSIGIAFLVLLFSLITHYISGKNSAKKTQQKLWNTATKKNAKVFVLGTLLIFSILIVLKNFGFINYITPTLLILYGILLFLLKNKARKDLLVLIALCILLGTLCFLIPSYWYSALIIISIVHVTYGVMVKK